MKYKSTISHIRTWRQTPGYGGKCSDHTRRNPSLCDTPGRTPATVVTMVTVDHMSLHHLQLMPTCCHQTKQRNVACGERSPEHQSALAVRQSDGLLTLENCWRFRGKETSLPKCLQVLHFILLIWTVDYKQWTGMAKTKSKSFLMQNIILMINSYSNEVKTCTVW